MKNLFSGCISLIVFIGALFYFFGGGIDKQAKFEMNKIQNQVADDSVQQYQIAKSGGDKMQICVQAGMVSAAYLQAKDQENYLKWKQTEKSDCKKAGFPR